MDSYRCFWQLFDFLRRTSVAYLPAKAAHLMTCLWPFYSQLLSFAQTLRMIDGKVGQDNTEECSSEFDWSSSWEFFGNKSFLGRHYHNRKMCVNTSCAQYIPCFCWSCSSRWSLGRNMPWLCWRRLECRSWKELSLPWICRKSVFCGALGPSCSRSLLIDIKLKWSLLFDA